MASPTFHGSSPVQVYIGPELARYGFGEGHPFGPDRMDAFWHEAVKQGIDKRVVIADPVAAKESSIRQFHTDDYIQRVIRQSKPEIIIFQCGADSIAGDPITHMRFSPAAHNHATASLCRIADEYCQGRIIALGGGGYNRGNLAAGWCAVLKKLCD
ncbi:MAG: hypothetical protein ACE5DZ_05365 [Mariprofundus sp.]